ncbi:hypothetical protein HanPI659440_Chr15g0617731 [Helianthus annuus]|nr:hypothetical protein HanPI659440_Chr15g0617731 [Helianthus annuus]
MGHMKMEDGSGSTQMGLPNIQNYCSYNTNQSSSFLHITTTIDLFLIAFLY